MSSLVFFFQAEDGIRDLVRSRGLGDVYKRQACRRARGRRRAAGQPGPGPGAGRQGEIRRYVLWRAGRDLQPVSYTHLTLPTSDLV